MVDHKHDLIIIGSGSTAFAAALRAEALGAKVLMIEKSALGGTCINWGCIPSKTLIHAALFRHEALLGRRLGTGGEPGELDYAALAAHKDDVVQQLRKERYLDVLRASPGLTLVKGTGRFLGPKQVEVVDQVYGGERFLIASGGFPRIPKIPGLESVDYLTSMSALLQKSLPASLIIVGGGVIAMELGQMYQRFGVRVTVLEHGPRILPAVEAEAALALQALLTAEGMEIIPNCSVCAVAKKGGQTVVQVEINGTSGEYCAERLLLAVGTAPATTGIGLELAGVATDAKGYVLVDEKMRTSTAGIWAAGDVVGGMMIATAGAREGMVAVEDMFTAACGCSMDQLTVPMAIFTDPEVGIVGYGEAAARAAGFTVVTNSLRVATVPKALVTGATGGVIKIVADKEGGRILGVHLACHRGAELINEAALAVRCKLTVADLANSLHVYPSIGEGLKLCAQGFSTDLSRLSCCAE